MRILLVEDDSDIRAVLALQCRSRGFSTVLVATDGKEALKLLETQEVDVVLTDLRMPNLNGIDLVRTLHAQHPELPVFMLTGYGEEAEEMAENAISGLFLKPNGFEAALDAVAKAAAERAKAVGRTPASTAPVHAPKA